MREQFIKRLLAFSLIGLVFYLSLNAHSEAYFSPDDHPAERLINLINGTKRKIYGAVYMFTDALIAEALINAKKRGVDVKIIVDNATMDYEYGKGELLKENGIDVYVFAIQGKKSKFGTPLMHNKFALLDNQLWTGSFNWTKSANQKNQENVIVTTNKKVYAKFEKQFEILKGRATTAHSYRSSNKQHSQSSRQRNKQLDREIDSFWDRLKDLFSIPPRY
ncbi:MAG: phospholipase D-like domain-containing protein [Candidatus Babeliales bacterium]|jgi:phosphatidylserine/phosphatidylglycerophosphate/cardiolipin synthase-like enzyme